MTILEIMEKIQSTGNLGLIYTLTTPNQISVYLPNHTYYGKIILHNLKPVFVKQEREKDTMRKYNAWGFHREVLSFVEALYVKTEEDIYKINTDVAFTSGVMDTVQEEQKLYVNKLLFLKASNL